MHRRMVQRGFALGLIGVLGAMFIAGPASGAAAQEEPESSGPAAVEEGLGEQALTPEEQEAMRAWVASMVEDAPAEELVKAECTLEPYECDLYTTCLFNGEGGKATSCGVTECGKGNCSVCPKYLSDIVIKSWCSFRCESNGKVVGSAFNFRVIFKTDKTNGPWCIDKSGNIYNKDGKKVWP